MAKRFKQIVSETFDLIEGRMSQLAVDMDELDDRAFKAKHKRSKQEMSTSLNKPVKPQGGMEESFEQIDEISGKTLASYSDKVARYGPMKDTKTRQKHEKGVYTAYKKMKAKDVKVPARMEETEITEAAAADVAKTAHLHVRAGKHDSIHTAIKSAVDTHFPASVHSSVTRKKVAAQALNRIKSSNAAKMKKEEVEQVEEGIKAYDKDNKLVGHYPDMKTAKKMKPDHKYIVALTKGWGDGGKSMKSSYGKLAKEEVEQIDEISADLARRAADKAYDNASAARGKSFKKGQSGTLNPAEKKANIQGRKFDRYANKKQNAMEESDLEEGQKPYVSHSRGGVGRSAEANVLNSKGETSKTFTKKEHGPDYMKKANAHLKKNYNKMTGEEVELDEGLPDHLKKHFDKNGNKIKGSWKDGKWTPDKKQSTVKDVTPKGYGPKEEVEHVDESSMKPIKLTPGWGDGGKSMRANKSKLAGKQHKIDANDDGKISADDFKILRNKNKARYQ